MAVPLNTEYLFNERIFDMGYTAFLFQNRTV